MNSFIAALHVETTKVIKSKMLWGTMIFFVFIAFMLSFMVLIAKRPDILGNSAIMSTKASFISKADWSGYFMLILQMGLSLGLIGPSIVTIWVFGREYSDRVIKDLLALPVSRTEIVVSKFIVSFAWSILLMILLYICSLIGGLFVHLDGWQQSLLLKNLGLYSAGSLLTILLLPVISFVTCISRGYLLPVGITILLMIGTQFLFIGLPSLTPVFPWAVPGLVSGVAGPLCPKPGFISFAALFITSASGIAASIAWWKYADQH
jgi:ABC-2 type transport system permease protein